MDFKDFMETMTKVFEVLFDATKWLNSNIFSRTGGLVDIAQKVIDFFKNLFSGDGFFTDLFSGDGLSLGGIGDFFGGLFG